MFTFEYHTKDGRQRSRIQIDTTDLSEAVEAFESFLRSAGFMPKGELMFVAPDPTKDEED